MDNERINIVRVTAESRAEVEETVVRERPLTIFLDGRELVTMLCSPVELEALSVGWLFSEGLLESRDNIKDISVDAERGMARVNTVDGAAPDSALPLKSYVASGGGRGTSFQTVALAGVKSGITIEAGQVLALVHDFQQQSPTFLETGGVHSAALCDTANILVFAEDIGRHNAIDKVFGRCLLDGIATADRILITSGRVSSEILLKVARRQVPIIISVSAPTDAGVALAESLGMTLVGFVRNRRMNIYTHDWRVR